MKTLLVLSDSHKNVRDIKKLYEIMGETDFIVHLGDYCSDMQGLLPFFGNKTYRVTGNCDFCSACDNEGVLEVEGVKIFYTHGHNYGVKSGLDRLVDRTKELGCQVALYGHTHIAKVETIDGIITVNPGCLKDYSPAKSYAYLVVADGKVTALINDTFFR